MDNSEIDYNNMSWLEELILINGKKFVYKNGLNEMFSVCETVEKEKKYCKKCGETDLNKFYVYYRRSYDLCKICFKENKLINIE